MKKQCVLDVEKLNCASCVEKIEKKLADVDGVIRASVNFASGKVTVEYNSEQVKEKQIIEAISDLGYPTHQHQAMHQHTDSSFLRLLILTILAFTLSLPLMLSMLGMPLPVNVQIILATVVQFGCGYSFYAGAWQGLKRFSANMDTLVALGTSAAYGYSLYSAFMDSRHMYFETSSLLISFILLGKLLELKAKRKAGTGMQALLQLQPRMAHVLVLEEIKDVPIEEVARDAVFFVRPGERVPFDGVILEGESHLDESLLTGESLPVAKKVGLKILAGTLNHEGLLKARVAEIGPDTALGQIIRLVEEAQTSKAPIQRVADRVTAVFVPIVLLIALMTFLAWWGIGLKPVEGLIAAIAVLVIACPCALGLATPTVIMVACDLAAKAGILIKDAAVLELAQNIHTLFLDKTGTVTEGELAVIQAIPSTHDARDFLSYALSLAMHSDHPASQAIQTIRKTNIPPLHMSQITAFPGKGLSGVFQGHTYYLGSAAFLRAMKVDTAEFEEKWKEEKDMVVAISDENLCLGYFLLADKVKPEAKEAIAQFHALGIKVFLLTGDQAPIAARVAKEVNADRFEAEILPEHKAEQIARLKKSGEITAMVGDGINDAPALAQADIGIAIGAGADVALETASVILVKSDLRGVAETIVLARKTFRKIRQNLYFAFGYNCLCIPIAALGLLNPIIAGIAMAMSSVSVVVNSLLLARESLRKQ